MWGFRIFSGSSEKQPRGMRQSQAGTSPPHSRLLLPESGSTFGRGCACSVPDCSFQGAQHSPVQLSPGEMLQECTELLPPWI